MKITGKTCPDLDDDPYNWQESINHNSKLFIKEDQTKAQKSHKRDWVDEKFNHLMKSQMTDVKNRLEHKTPKKKDPSTTNIEWVFGLVRVEGLLTPRVCGWPIADGKVDIPLSQKTQTHGYLFKNVGIAIDTVAFDGVLCSAPLVESQICPKTFTHGKCGPEKFHPEVIKKLDVLSVLKMRRVKEIKNEQQIWTVQDSSIKDVAMFWSRRNLIHNDIVFKQILPEALKEARRMEENVDDDDEDEDEDEDEDDESQGEL